MFRVVAGNSARRITQPGRLSAVNRGLVCFIAFAIGVLVQSPLEAAHAQAREVQDKPSVRLTGVAIKRVDWEKRIAESTLSIEVDNPGAAFTLNDLSYRLKLNDKQAAEGKREEPLAIPAHSRAAVELPCFIDFSVLPGVAWSVIAGGFDVHYELETEFTLPLLPPFSPRIKTSFGGDLSLAGTVSGVTAKIKEQISNR